MDVVYILGSGSLTKNAEVLYSVRSLAAHMYDLEKVFVVGDEPANLPGVVHLPAPDRYDKQWKNTLAKTRLACERSDVSEEFLLMNDDFFMLSGFLGAEFPFYSISGIDGGPNGMRSFQVHCPIRFNKDWYLKMPLYLDMPGDFSPRSFYANFYRAPATPVTDFILRGGEGVPSFDEQIAGRDFFSISNATMTDGSFRVWLDGLFPEPCLFEQ